MSEADLIVLRPAPGPRRQVLMIAAVIAVVLVIAGVMAGGRPALITCIVLALLLAAAAAVYLGRSRIVVTPAEISVRGLWFHHRRDRTLAAALVRATVVQPMAAPAETIVVVDVDDRALLRINGALYSTSDLDRLVDHLGLISGGPDRPVTLGQLARERPGSVGWVGRHPVAFTLLCALGFAVLAVVLGAVIAGLSG
ncbi:hypothetical protein [Jiangella mangrovi]|uniref:PH domain-containing protein n=1 Tax=Jiangella mangrovi TaxID=1524084 RepID=A0A7W9GST5_9ACTN|nr:hypothetical protein [Jiangella mangrovi]MBB5789405.1 hypothetical protein [Jiangella mangrovi]